MTVTIAILGGFAGIMQFSVVRPIHQRFDAQDKYINQRFDAQDKYINQRFDAQDQRIADLRAEMNQRFDAQDRRIEELARDVSELRKFSERISRNETRLDALTEQLQTADAPLP